MTVPNRLAATVTAVALCGLSAACVRADRIGEPTSTTPATTTPPTGQPGSGLIQDTDPAWVWSGMVPCDDPTLHGSSGHAGGPGTAGTYTFHGTAVDVYGMNGPSVMIGSEAHSLGRAQVIVDGKVVGLSTVTAPTATDKALICHVDSLTEGNHVIEIQPEGGWVVVDYLKVTDTPQAAGAGSAYSGSSLLPEGDYAIYPRHAPEKCLDVPGLTDNTMADINTPNAERAEVWHITPLGQEHYRISPVAAPDEALSTLGAPDSSGGMSVGLYRYVGNPAQQWLLSPTDSGYCQLLFAAQTVRCLDVSWSSHNDGTPLIAYPNTAGVAGRNSYNEQFMLQRVR